MKYVAYVETTYVGSKVTHEFEIPDEDLEGLTPIEVETFVDEWAHDIVFDGSMFEWGWEVAQ